MFQLPSGVATKLGIKLSLQAGSLESGEHSLVFTAPEAACTATATHIDEIGYGRMDNN